MRIFTLNDEPEKIALLLKTLTTTLVGAPARSARHTRTAPVRTRRKRPYTPPIPITPLPPPYEVPPRAALVRPYVRDSGHCARRREAQAKEARRREERQRHGIAALMDLGRPDPMWHCHVAACKMSAPKPVAHPCPLTGLAREDVVLEGAR